MNNLAKNAYDLKSFKRSQSKLCDNAAFDGDNKLEIDYDYYKSIAVEPVGRLLVNINNQIYDQIVSNLGISKQRIKNIK